MDSDLFHRMMNGQNDLWTVAIIGGVLAGLLDLWMSYRARREQRRQAALLDEEQAEAVEVAEEAPPSSPLTAARGAEAEVRITRAAAVQPATEPVPSPQAATPRPATAPALSAPPAAEPVATAAATRAAPAVPSFPRRRFAESVDPSLTAEELLERAEQLLAAGQRADAAAHFRGSIRMAQKNKLPAVEAKARIELGDLSKENGDLTSACEHWQMARVLFANLEKPADVESTIARMEKAGCPTDWVLNEF